MIPISVSFKTGESSVQFSCSVISDCLQPHGLQHARPPCPTPTPRIYSNSSIDLVMPSNHLILLSPSPPTFSFPSIRVFSDESFQFHIRSFQFHIRWPKSWTFSFSISPSNEYSGLISLRMDRMDLLAIQGLSRVFYNTTVQKHQFFNAQLSLYPNSHIHT